MHTRDNVITLKDSGIEAIMKMAEGNPGALTTLFELVKKDNDLGLVALCHLDDMQIRGWRIWVGFNDYCKRNIDDFFEKVMSRDKAMQDFIAEYK